MTLTPATLTRHELIGLPVRVVDAPNPDAVGITGRVVSETTNTLVVRGARLFPAAGSASETAVDDGAATAARTAAMAGDGAADDTVAASDTVEADDTAVAANDTAASDATVAASDVASETAVRGRDESSDDRRGSREDERRLPKREATFEFAVPTDEAASRRLLGSAFELPWETAGTGSTRPAGQSGGCESVGYVTVDGARLVARPARRTERAGDTLWQSD